MDASIPKSAARILDFIGDTEAPHGYDTVFGNNKMPRPLTTMTLDEVIADGPRRTRAYRSSACGRYQFMTDTLKGLKKECGLSGAERFTPDLQNRLAFQLLKNRKWEQFEAGRIGLSVFARNLAMEWASLPVLATTQGAKGRVKRGQSYYAGDGLNRALVHPEQIEALLAVPSAAPAMSQATVLAAQPIAAPVTPASTSWFARVGTAIGVLPKPAVAAPVLPAADAPAPTELVRRVQVQLQALGYSEVGLADGMMGPNTRKAIKAFCDEQTPPIASTGDVTDEFLAAIAKGRARPISEERARATAKDLRDAGNEPARGLHTLGWLGTAILGTGGIGQLDQTGILDSLKSTSDSVGSTFASVQGGLTTIVSIVQWCMHHWPLFAIGGGVYMLYRVARAVLELVALFRNNVLARAR